MIKLKQIDGNEIEIIPQSDQAKAHFADANNYAMVVIDEFSHEPFKGYIKPDSVILDIGANIGLFALHVMPYVKEIVCVEPTPEHMEIQGNLFWHNWHNIRNGKFHHEQSALNSYTGTARFRKEPVNTTMNSLSDRLDSFEVNCITLFDLCEKYKLDSVDFCKIDIEGSEFKAITIDRVQEVSHIIKAFWLETHPRNLESMTHFKYIFEQCGYKVELIDFNGTVYATK